MGPKAPSFYLADCSNIDAVFGSDIFVAYPSTASSSYIHNFSSCQSSSTVQFPDLTSPPRSSFSNHIRGIVRSSASEQMIWVNTTSIVASMTYIKSDGNRSFSPFVRKSVSRSFPSRVAQSYSAVPFYEAASPIPAASGDFSNLSPKPIIQTHASTVAQKCAGVN